MNQETLPVTGFAFMNTITGKLATADGRIVFQQSSGSGPTNKMRNSSEWSTYAHASLIMERFDVSFDVARRMQNAYNHIVYSYRPTDNDNLDIAEFEHVVNANVDFFQNLRDTKFSEQKAFVKVKVTGVQIER